MPARYSGSRTTGWPGTRRHVREYATTPPEPIRSEYCLKLSAGGMWSRIFDPLWKQRARNEFEFVLIHY